MEKAPKAKYLPMYANQYHDFINDIKKLLESDSELSEIVVIRNVDGKLEENHITKENGKQTV